MLAFSPIAIPFTVMVIALLWLYLTLPIPIYGTLWILLVGFVGKVRATYGFAHSDSPAAGGSIGLLRRSLAQNVSQGDLAADVTPGLLIGFLFILSLSFRVLSLPVMISHVNTRMLPSFIFDLYDEGKYEVLSALGVLILLFLLLIAAASRYVSSRFGVQETH